MELDKRDFFFKQAKSNLTEKYENLHKNNWAPPFFNFFFTKVEWDGRARWTLHARKLVRATLTRTSMVNMEEASDYLIIPEDSG